MEFTLLFAVLTAFAAMWITRRALGPRIEDVDKPLDAMLGAAAVGLLAGRVAAMIADGINPLTNPFEAFLVRAGVMTEVAAPVALATLLWMWRDHLPAWPDAAAPVAVAGLAGWHAGCVWRGTCLGTASELPWAFAIDGSTVTRHPVELYAAIGLIGIVPLLARLRRQPWAATGLAIAWSAVIRLMTQPLRPSITGGPVAFYSAAVLIGLTAMVAGWWWLGRAADTDARRPAGQDTTP